MVNRCDTFLSFSSSHLATDFEMFVFYFEIRLPLVTFVPIVSIWLSTLASGRLISILWCVTLFYDSGNTTASIHC